MGLYSGTYNVLQLTDNAAFNYGFTMIVVFLPVIVTIHLIVKIISRS